MANSSGVKLILGDCLEKMPNLPTQTIDMVLADVPYGTTACKWDSVIPFEPMWAELKRITKPNGAICLFGSEPFSSLMRISNVSEFKYDWVWLKNRPTGFVNAKLMPLKAWETVSVFSSGKTANGSENNMPYFPQGLVRCDKQTRSPSAPKNENSYSRPSHQKTFLQEFTNYPKNVLSFSKDDKERLHPTQKPVALLEYLIRTYTRPGDIVLDFTMGSGSTGVACVNTGRLFIGIEKDERYYEIAQKRVADAQAAREQAQLPLPEIPA